MPYAAGTYAAPSNSWNPAVAGSAINATDWAALLADLATALSTCMLKDGTQTMTANLPMGGFKITGLAAGSTAGDSLRYEQLLATQNPGLALIGPSTGAAATPTFRALTGFDLPLRSYLSGLGMSTAGSSATMSIAAGQATDGGGTQGMTLASALAKTTSAWAVGNAQGGLDTGSISTATWYHFWLIMRADTGVVDVLISLSATSPTMPTNYTLKRRIGSGLTDGSSHWTAFTQDGDLFEWSVPVRDINATTSGTNAVTRTLASIPTGVNVRALLNVTLNVSTSDAVYLSDLATTDAAASGTNAPAAQVLAPTNSNAAGQVVIRTNTSAQIRSRQTTGGATETLNIISCGWYDRRGRDS